MERNIGKYTCIIGKWLNYYRKIVSCATKRLLPLQHTTISAHFYIDMPDALIAC